MNGLSLHAEWLNRKGEHQRRTLLQMSPVALESEADMILLPALSLPPPPPPPQLHRKGGTLLPSARGYGGGAALSLSASQLTLLRCFNSHFLYKIDALTAASVCRHPHTGTVQWLSSASCQPSCKKMSFHRLPSSPMPQISYNIALQHHNPGKFSPYVNSLRNHERLK